MKELWRKLRQISPKTLRIVLFSLAGALAIAAVIVFLVLWNEGVTAGKNAQAVLDASGITPLTSASVSPSGTSAEQPGSSASPAATLQPELKGYSVIARIDIDSIDIHLPVLAETSPEALKVSACYYEGEMPGEDGNTVITGHHYSNGSIFGHLDDIKVGDTVLITMLDGSTYTYTVYELDHITPDHPEKLDDTEYARELTLLTCESHGNGRLVVRCNAAE